MAARNGAGRRKWSGGGSCRHHHSAEGTNIVGRPGTEIKLGSSVTDCGAEIQKTTHLLQIPARPHREQSRRRPLRTGRTVIVVRNLQLDRRPVPTDRHKLNLKARRRSHRVHLLSHGQPFPQIRHPARSVRALSHQRPFHREKLRAGRAPVGVRGSEYSETPPGEPQFGLPNCGYVTSMARFGTLRNSS